MKVYKVVKKDRPIYKPAGLPFPEDNAFIQTGTESGWIIIRGGRELLGFFRTKEAAERHIKKNFSPQAITRRLRELEKQKSASLKKREKEINKWYAAAAARLCKSQGVLKS